MCCPPSLCRFAATARLRVQLIGLRGGGVGQQVIGRLRDDCTGAHKAHVRQHYDDNYLWITQAMANKLVVGSQARILYADAEVLV